MQKIVVLGGGESGVGSAILAKDKGFEVFLSDNGTITVEFKDMLLKYHINFEEGGHTFDKILQADEIIKSPGIPDTAPIIKAARERKIHIISEILAQIRPLQIKGNPAAAGQNAAIRIP